MPNATPSTAPAPRPPEVLLADACMDLASSFLQHAHAARNGDVGSVQEIARLGAHLQHLAHTTEAAMPKDAPRVFSFVDPDDLNYAHCLTGTPRAVEALEALLKERFQEGVDLGKAQGEELLEGWQIANRQLQRELQQARKEPALPRFATVWHEGMEVVPLRDVREMFAAARKAAILLCDLRALVDRSGSDVDLVTAVQVALDEARADGARVATGSQVLLDVLAELRSQRATRTTEEDDLQDGGELAMASACYAEECAGNLTLPGDVCEPPKQWPWDSEAWQPSEHPRANAVRAAALAVLEAERLDRAERLMVP